MTSPDPSGMLRFVADELQRAEDLGQRAWIIAHVRCPRGYCAIGRSQDSSCLLSFNCDCRCCPAGTVPQPSKRLRISSIKSRSVTRPMFSPLLSSGYVFLRLEPCIKYKVTYGRSLQHVHDEMMYLTFSNNGTVQNEQTALTNTWVGPSLTPLTNLNSGTGEELRCTGSS